MTNDGYVLAMYDVRGKQDFIFRTDKLKEIVGASWLIRDVFRDYLVPAANKLSERGIFFYDPDRPDENPFTVADFQKHLSEGYLGEVVYNGGGNFLVLFRDEETFREVTYAFTLDVMKATGTLRVLGTAVGDVDFDNYKNDSSRLYEKHRAHEANESKTDPYACLPIVLVDRKTSMPITVRNQIGEYSRESYAKLAKYRSVMEKVDEDHSMVGRYFVQNEKVFDKLVAKKGEDSQLAVVYIDGNNMGAKVQEATAGKTNYEDCVNRLRIFSGSIQQTYVEHGIHHALGDQKEGGHRIVVYAGDEVNFVVRASDAFGCARNYLEGLSAEDGASACAGIAVFHSHAPYADAYRIAEEACESGKQVMKDNGMDCASFIDFHICQGAIGMSLEAIREAETGEIISRPWLMSHTGDIPDGVQSMEEVDRLTHLFHACARTNVKGLADAAKKSPVELNLELMRIHAHMSEAAKSELQSEWKWLNIPAGSGGADALDDHRKRKLIYDAAIAYDLWLAGKEDA